MKTIFVQDFDPKCCRFCEFAPGFCTSHEVVGFFADGARYFPSARLNALLGLRTGEGWQGARENKGEAREVLFGRCNADMPLVVFSHGLGGIKTQNSIQAEELASRGYVVIAADHAFDAFLTLFEDGTTADYRSSGQGITTEEEFWAARGPQLATRTADVVFMLDVITTAQNGAESALQIANPNPLWQRVDLSRIGVFGHSFGGATGIMALVSDPRIRAAVVLDGWMVPVPEAIIDRGASKPLLYLGQESWGEPLNYEKLARFEANSSGLVTTEILAGTKHMDFSDSPHLSSFAKRVGFAGSVPAEQLRAKLNADILRFFADYADADSIEQQD